MKLTEVLENQKLEYNQFVASSSTGSFLQSFEWGQWNEKLGREVFRYWILDDVENKIGSIQLVKMALPLKKFYLYAPYGPVLRSSFAEASEDKQGYAGQAGDEMLGLLKEKFRDAIFIRIEAKTSVLSTGHYPLITKTANIQPSKTLLVDLSKSEELLLSEMHHKTRYNIKVANKHGVEIKNEFDISIGHGLFFDEAIKLITETSKRQKFTTFSSSYYKNMADFLALNNQGDLTLNIYKAIFQNQLLATAYMLDFGGTRTFLFGGSSEFHKNVMAPYLLHWQAMKDAKAKGLNNYDFWGIETASGATPGFVRFKLGFTEDVNGIKEYGGACDIINNKTQYQLYKMSRSVNKFIKKMGVF